MDRQTLIEKGIEKPGCPDKSTRMGIQQLKNEIKELGPVELDQVAALILQLRRSNDPERTRKLAEMIDDPDVIAWKKSTAPE